LHGKDIIGNIAVVHVSPLPVQDAILAGWVVHVHRHNVDVSGASKGWKRSALTRGRVTDAEGAMSVGEQEEAIARGVDLKTVVVAEPEDRAATLHDWQAALGTGCEEGKGRLAPVVSE
jgi:hypothetical protein